MADDDQDNDNVMLVHPKTNKCYKSYTHSGKLKYVVEKNSSLVPLICTEVEVFKSDESRRTLRRRVVPCAPPSVYVFRVCVVRCRSAGRFSRSTGLACRCTS